jgi:hypothetical protein
VNDNLEIQRIQSGALNLSVEALISGRSGHGVGASDPDIAGRVYLFLPEYECWFEGCKELREAYLAEIAALEAEAAAKGVPCAGCDIGDIKRKYIAKMRHHNYPLFPESSHVSHPKISRSEDPP